MADQFATPEDLSSLLLRDDIDENKATILIETATAIVQEAAGGQRILQVVDDELPILSTTESWLQLPQIPVTAISSVTLDGTVLVPGTDFKIFKNRLWRRLGWQSNWGQYDAGLAPGSLGGNGSVAYEYNYGQSFLTYGWMSQSEPSQSVIVYTHGYVPDAQELQLARSAVLSLCAGAYGNPDRVAAESIDDYRVTYDKLASQMELTPFMAAAIRRKYGRRGNFVRLG